MLEFQRRKVHGDGSYLVLRVDIDLDEYGARKLLRHGVEVRSDHLMSNEYRDSFVACVCRYDGVNVLGSFGLGAIPDH